MQDKNGLKKKILSNISDIPYLELQERFIRSCQARNLADDTIRFYETGCNNFGKFVDLKTLKARDISRELIEGYIFYLKSRGLRGVSINSYVRGISAVARFGMSLGVTEHFEFKQVKEAERIKQCYTEAELSTLLKKPKMTSFADYRNWVIINFLLGTGVRALELRSLRICDVDMTAGMLLVSRTKNRKQRYVPLSRTLTHVLSEYLVNRKPDGENSALFCNEYGEFMPRSTLQMAITKYCKRRGVTHYSLHLFRHTYAKNWITSGGDAFSLQKLLGHSSLKMVGIYVNLYGTDLKRNYDRFCVLETVMAGVQKDRIVMPAH